MDPPQPPKGPKGTQGDPRGPKGTQGDPRAPSAPLGGMGPWGPLGVIPKPFRMESNFEWKAGPKWTQRDPKGPQGTQGNPRGKPFRDEVGTFCPHFFRSPFIQDKTSHSTASTKRSKGGERTTIALQLGITANEWTVFLTILDTVQNWVQTCTFNHPLRAVCLQKRFKTTF